MVKRIYSTGMRTFEIMLTPNPAETCSSWMIEIVKEVSAGGRDLAIPGIYDVVATAEDVAFARACDCIDKWLMSNR